MARRKLTEPLTLPPGTEIDDLLYGGPGNEPAPHAPPAGPAMKEITISGVKYLVPADAATAIESANTAVAGELSRTQAELATAKAAKPPAAAPAIPAAGDDDIESMIFLNPKAALAKAGEQWKKELRSEYTLAQAQQKWWDTFYTDYKHLVPAKIMVQAVMTANFAELSKLPDNLQAKGLADKVDAELAGIIKARADSTAPRTTAAPVEAGGVTRSAPAPTAPAADAVITDRVVSIGEMQRKQRERRMQARTGRASA